MVKISITFSVLDIGEGAFEDCSSLKQITIPSSVTSIRNSVFHNCRSLKNVDFPSTLTSIGSSSFSDCSMLEVISLPPKLQSIGKFAFAECFNLNQINFPQSLKEIEYQAFVGCQKIYDVKIPSHIDIYKNSYKEMLINRKNVEKIGELNKIDSRIEIFIAGFANVGKTCLISRYTRDIFPNNTFPTVGVNPNYTTAVVNYKYLEVNLYDTSQYCIRYNLIMTYIHKLNGIMLVFDLSNRESLEFVLNWYKCLSNEFKNKLSIILVGNKSDLKDRITYEEANEIAFDYDLPYFEISTLNNSGINEAFDYILSSVLEFKPHFDF